MTANPTYARRLAQRAAQARAQQADLQQAIQDLRTTRSLTFADDEHDPEGSTLSLDQARDAALLDRVTQTLSEVTAAQHRLAAGTYGRCETCGGDVAPERLRARPEVRDCIGCAARRGTPRH